MEVIRVFRKQMIRFGVVIGTGVVSVAAAWAASAPIVKSAVRVDVANKNNREANETSCAVAQQSPLEVATSWNDWRDDNGSGSTVRTGVGLTTDGVNWTDFTLRPPSGNRAAVEGDPMACVDPRTGTIWVGAISFAGNGGIYVAQKKAGLNEFEASVMARKSGGTDKCWMAAGPDPADPENTTQIHVAYNEGSITSNDMGKTWTAPKSLGSGIGFLPRIAPDGTYYVAYWDFGSNFFLKRSTDGGKTFSANKKISGRMGTWGIDDSETPGTFRVPPFANIAVDPRDGTLYACYMDRTDRKNGRKNVFNIDVYFRKSTNQGDTWSDAIRVNGESDPVSDSFMPWMEVDSRGRIHIFYYDTRQNPDQSDNGSDAKLDVYYSYSDNGGQSWNEMRISEKTFTMSGNIWWFMGDYIGASCAKNRTYLNFPMVDSNDLHAYVQIIIDPRGDMNCDEVIDFDDIDPFVMALIDQSEFETNYPECNYQNGDLDGDNSVTFADIDRFVEFVTE